MQPLLTRIARRFGYDVRKGPPLFEHYLNYARATDAWVSQVSKLPVRTILDVGAFDGSTALDFRRQFPVSTIYAFEPSPSTFSLLQQRARGDQLLHSIHSAVGERDGSTTLHEAVAPGANSLLPTAPTVGAYSPAELNREVRAVSVPITRLDTFCQREHLERVDILKIDAQGYERHILDGCGEWLSPSRIRGIVMELLFVSLYVGQTWAGEALEHLRARGYRCFGIGGIAYDDINGWKWGDAWFL